MSDQERAVGGGDSGEDEEVRVGPSASAKFGAAFAKILGKRDAAEASGHLGGLERLEVRTQKAVRVDKKDDGAFMRGGSVRPGASHPRAVREGRRLRVWTPPPALAVLVVRENPCLCVWVYMWVIHPIWHRRCDPRASH
jgi:hypothetical protein